MDVLDRITELAARSQDAPVPAIDVRVRVRATLREYNLESLPVLDRSSLTFAGVSVAFAAILFLTYLPSVRLLWDPWLAYMSAPWSY